MNSGTINLNSTATAGIRSVGFRDTVSNTGVISSNLASSSSFGISATGGSASITNSGRVATKASGDGLVAVGSFGDGSTVINTGTLATLGFNSSGVRVQSNLTTVTNRSGGTIYHGRIVRLRLTGSGDQIVSRTPAP